MEITVIKKNTLGQETWRYHGRLIDQTANCLVLEAFFDRQDLNLKGLLLGKGDRFIETWYTDRWYNVFEIHSRDDDCLRGWYCNIGAPAVWEGQQISYVDLCLDLIVFPDGRQIVLDEDEFAALEIPPETRQQALDALAVLQQRSWRPDQTCR
jgi:uncharacterized protein